VFRVRTVAAAVLSGNQFRSLLTAAGPGYAAEVGRNPAFILSWLIMSAWNWRGTSRYSTLPMDRPGRQGGLGSLQNRAQWSAGGPFFLGAALAYQWPVHQWVLGYQPAETAVAADLPAGYGVDRTHKVLLSCS